MNERFETWWSSYWKNVGPPVLDMAFKEIAENAWKAALAIITPGEIPNDPRI